MSPKSLKSISLCGVILCIFVAFVRNFHLIFFHLIFIRVLDLGFRQRQFICIWILKKYWLCIESLVMCSIFGFNQSSCSQSPCSRFCPAIGVEWHHHLHMLRLYILAPWNNLQVCHQSWKFAMALRFEGIEIS